MVLEKQMTVIMSLHELDLAQKIFGVLNSKPSRVFFEDAFLFVEKGNTVEQSPKRVPKILSTPKPTSYQLYLEQNNPNNPVG